MNIRGGPLAILFGRILQRARNNKGRPLSRPSLYSAKNYAFLGAIASFAALATRNFTTVLALI
jgi:hypothetical protein